MPEELVGGFCGLTGRREGRPRGEIRGESQFGRAPRVEPVEFGSGCGSTCWSNKALPKAGSECDGGVDSVAGRDRGEGRAVWREREARLVFNLFNWKIGKTALPPLTRSNSPPGIKINSYLCAKRECLRQGERSEAKCR